jgi:thiol:disulfide interchange protein DsbC
MMKAAHKKISLPILLCLTLILLVASAATAKDTLDLDKAVKIGSGKTMVIEVTDPECPFCKRAEAYFRVKPQVTRYIFFLPLASHPGSKEKVQYILSAKDKTKAYLEVMSGRWDSRKLAAITPEGVKLQKEHQEIARLNNVRSTPTFMIYGRVITGLDLNTLEPLLR